MLLSNKRNVGLGLEVLMGVFSLFFGGTEGLRVFFVLLLLVVLFQEGRGVFPFTFFNQTYI